MERSGSGLGAVLGGFWRDSGRSWAVLGATKTEPRAPRRQSRAPADQPNRNKKADIEKKTKMLKTLKNIKKINVFLASEGSGIVPNKARSQFGRAKRGQRSRKKALKMPKKAKDKQERGTSATYSSQRWRPDVVGSWRVLAVLAGPPFWRDLAGSWEAFPKLTKSKQRAKKAKSGML